MGIWNKTVEMHLICTFENLSSVFSWFSSPIMIILDYSRIFTRKRVLKIYIFCIIQILKLPLLLETARNKSNGWETVLPINIKVTVEYRYIRLSRSYFFIYPLVTFAHFGPLMCSTISHPLVLFRGISSRTWNTSEFLLRDQFHSKCA